MRPPPAPGRLNSFLVLALAVGSPAPAWGQGALGGSPGAAPGGLTAEDWAGIRRSMEAHRRAIRPSANGHVALNAEQGWTALFDGRGFELRPTTGGWSWGLELVSYGFGDRAIPVASPSRIRVDGARLAYGWGPDLEEWYVHGERGLEHGFTLLARPPQPLGREGECEPLSFLLRTRGGLEGRAHGDGAGVSFTGSGDAAGVGRASLSYAGLLVFDARGRALPSSLQLVPEGLLLTVEEAGAPYPLTIDPLVEKARLTASNTGFSDLFGEDVAVSGDTVVVGAQNEDSSSAGVNLPPIGTSTDSGAAYVFVRSGAGWTQEAYLKASNTGAQDGFGFSVSISGDTIVVGAPFEDSAANGVNGNMLNDGATHAGAAYVFVRNGTTWTQQAYLKASNSDALDSFGGAVAVHGDTVVVGAQHEDSSATGVDGPQGNVQGIFDSGAAYVFVRNGTSWSQQAYLKASNTDAGDFFGRALSLWEDTLVVGAISEDGGSGGVDGEQDDNSTHTSGAAYIFTRRGTTWAQEAYLKASNPDVVDSFGIPVAIWGDTVVVGATGEDSGATGVNGDQADNSASGAGAAYVFARTPAGWVQEAYLKPFATDADDRFGDALAVWGDTVLVGAPGDDGSDPDDPASSGAFQSGAAYVFTRTGRGWIERSYLKASTLDESDGFGSAAAAADGLLVVGTPFESNVGAVFAFEDPCGPVSLPRERVRVGRPANPAALLPGITQAPVVGADWDPVVDHGSFLPGALFDVLALSTTTANLPVRPFGTVLCGPPTRLQLRPAGAPFRFPIPNDCTLIGAQLCAQALSVDAAGQMKLTNALDLEVGNL